jgi:copper oxidase (laccase) domain-containing protein
MGLAESNIEVSKHCTISEAGVFHSYRRDGNRSGRMLAVIGILEQ